MIAFLQIARRTGAHVDVVPDDDTGQLSVDALREMIDERARLIAMSWIPTQGGLVNPAAEVGAVAREAEVPYLLDACQAVGPAPDRRRRSRVRLPLRHRPEVPARAARHRPALRARARGSSAWSRRSSTSTPPRWTRDDAIEIRADARRFETWEHSVANRLGLGSAVDYTLAIGIDAIDARVTMLGEALRERLRALPGVTLRDLGTRRCGLVTFTVENEDPFALAARLRDEAINISVSTIDFARYDLGARGLDAIARASVHYYNTEEELDRLAEAVARGK